jgi:hypothetical protein
MLHLHQHVAHNMLLLRAQCSTTVYMFVHMCAQTIGKTLVFYLWFAAVLAQHCCTTHVALHQHVAHNMYCDSNYMYSCSTVPHKTRMNPLLYGTLRETAVKTHSHCVYTCNMLCNCNAQLQHSTAQNRPKTTHTEPTP